MIPLFELRAKILVDSLHERLEKRPNERCDMQTEFQKLTFDVIGLVSMGIDFGSQTEEANPYERAWEVVLNQLMFRFYFPLPKFVWDWLWFVPAVQEFRDSIGLLETAIQDAIDLRKKAIQVEGVAEDASDLLSLMLRQQQECPADDATLYDDKKIQRELLTFMFAGHDTTRSTLCWLLVGSTCFCTLCRGTNSLDSTTSPKIRASKNEYWKKYNESSRMVPMGSCCSIISLNSSISDV